MLSFSLPLLPTLAFALIVSGYVIEGSQRNITFATLNIRYDWSGDVIGWGERKGYVAQDVILASPDLIAFQEAMHHQLFGPGALLPLLAAHGYASEPHTSDEGIVGVGRADGREGGEYVAITYKVDIMKVVGKGYVWLCGSVGSHVPCKHHAAAEIRIMTWALFEMRTSPERFGVISTHLDHVSVAARIDGVTVILDELRRHILTSCSSCPIIVLGDFNAESDDPSLDLLRNDGFVDVFDASDLKPLISNTSQVREEGDDSVFYCYDVTRRIDYIFYRNSTPTLLLSMNHTASCYLYSGIIQDFWVNPSDHLMVIASLSLSLAFSFSSPPESHGIEFGSVVGVYQMVLMALIVLSLVLSIFILYFDSFVGKNQPGHLLSSSSSSLPSIEIELQSQHPPEESTTHHSPSISAVG
jgi:endonuclease/exonuclease/phosphatase family metal-dependent hydrolase